jgi:antitoxin VapB
MSGVENKGRAFDATPPARAKLFMHGGSQAVRLPKAFRFEGAEVEVRREGDRVVLTPLNPAPLPRTPEEKAAFWARIDAIRGAELMPYPPRDDLQSRLDDGDDQSR